MENDNINKENGMTKVIIAVIALVVILGAGAYFLMGSNNTPSQNKTTYSKNSTVTSVAASSSPAGQSSTGRQIAMSEVAKHSTSTDCWMVISNNVYDVTSFIASGQHEGGDEILRGCGIDATQLFETQGRVNGRPHRNSAYDMLDQYFIGVVQSS